MVPNDVMLKKKIEVQVVLVIHDSSLAPTVKRPKTYRFWVRNMTQRAVNSKAYGNIWPILTVFSFSFTRFVIYGRREIAEKLKYISMTIPTTYRWQPTKNGFFSLHSYFVFYLQFSIYFALCVIYICPKCPWVKKNKIKNRITNIK